MKESDKETAKETDQECKRKVTKSTVTYSQKNIQKCKGQG